jgi:hypothetical protein
MKNAVLFILAFLTVAALLISTQLGDMPDYQAYTRPKPLSFEELK